MKLDIEILSAAIQAGCATTWGTMTPPADQPTYRALAEAVAQNYQAGLHTKRRAEETGLERCEVSGPEDTSKVLGDTVGMLNRASKLLLSGGRAEDALAVSGTIMALSDVATRLRSKDGSS